MTTKMPATFEDWTPPWEKNGTEFDAETAAKMIYNLKREIETEGEKASAAKADLQARLDAANTALTEATGRVNALEDEKITDAAERQQVQFKREMEGLRDEFKQMLLGSRAEAGSGEQPEGSAGTQGVTSEDRLRVALATGLTEQQAARLVGNTYEELLADGRSYARDMGIASGEDDLRYDDPSDDGEMPSGVPARQGFRTDLGGNSGRQSFDPAKERDLLGRR